MDESRLSFYIHKFHGTVYRLAYSYLKNPDDAEDVVQETFLRLYLSNTEFETDENIKAWLIRVAINLSKDMLKSSWFRGRTELDKDIPAKEKNEDTISEIIEKLKPEYRVVIFLFYYEGYSVREIAEMNEISVSAATTRLSRARKKLKKLLLKEGYYEE